MAPYYPKKESQILESEGESPELSPEEFEQLSENILKVSNLLQSSPSVLLVSDYKTGNKRGKENPYEIIKHELNKSQLNGFSLNDLSEMPEETSLMLQFRIIADMADYILILLEPDVETGPIIESSIITNNIYFDKTFLFAKGPLSESELNDQYSWMVENGIISLFADVERLYWWSDLEELVEKTDRFIGDINERRS